MTEPLAGAWAKVERADKQTRLLNREFRAFARGKTRRIAHGPDPESSDYIFWVEVVKETPVLRWGVRIGEIAHNLRSALDHLAWQLALAHLRREPTEKEASLIHFPIAKTKPDFNSFQVLAFISTDHADLLRPHQPYHGGGDPAKHPLAVLQRLSNHDKHRVVQTTLAALSDFRMEVNPVRDCEITDRKYAPPGIALEQGAELARIQGRPTGPEPEFEGKANLSGHIAFRDGTVVGRELDAIRATAREVLDTFKDKL
jgi:hypothetical protein